MKTITEASIDLGRRLHQALALGLTLFTLTAASMVPAAETVIYYHLDALGSPVAATDANGAVVWKEDYQPYGNRVEYQDGNTNSLWYTGKERDTAVGLDYFGARWYNPTLGRFNAIDPVDFDEANIHSFNRYAYANNNPYRYVDPDGRAPWDKNQRGINNPFGLDAGFGPGRGPGGKLDVGAGRINENKSFSQIKAAQDQAVTKGAAGGNRAGKSFTRKGKAEIDTANAERHGGTNVCENCGTQVVPGQKSQRGVTPPGNERHRDHIIPRSKDGDGNPSNGQILCRNCNLDKSDKL